MRIAQLIDSLNWGGAQKMLTVLSRELASRDVETVVFSLGNDPQAVFARQLRDMGVEVRIVPGHGMFDPARIRFLRAELRNGKFDLLQTYLTYANILGALAGKLAGVPVVASLRSAGTDQRHYHPLRYHLESFALRSLARGVLANGYAIADYHQARAGQKPIKVIPNAVPLFPSLPAEERASLRRELVGERTGALVISVGRLSAPKGYPDLILAFAEALGNYPTASLVIVGGGGMEAEIRALLRSLNLEESVILTGAREDIPRLLAASDLYVSASHWEGMSVALLEGMSSGLPVIATAVGDAPRMVTPENGLLVQPKQPAELSRAMQFLLADPARMQSMGQAGRERVARDYSLQAWTDSFLAFYNSLISKSPRKFR